MVRSTASSAVDESLRAAISASRSSSPIPSRVASESSAIRCDCGPQSISIFGSAVSTRRAFAADEREWGIGNQILAELGLTTIRLLTNNPKKVSGLQAYGLDVTEQVPIEIQPNDENRRYLAAKRDKLGHKLHHQGLKFESESE